MFKQFFSSPTDRLTFLVAIATLASGCTLVPGTNISSNVFQLPANLEANKPAVEASIVKITPSVVANLEVTPLDMPQRWYSNHGAPYDYKIGVGDVLSIVVWDHPELTAPFGSFNNVQDQGNVVREDGTIFYPFVGQLEVAGRTALDIREELAVKLASYIESPQLDVRVVNYRSQRFFVTGFVSKPGTYPVTDVPVRVVEALPMTNRALTLTQALGEAGGIQEARADGRGVYVIRKSEFAGVIDVYQLDVSEAWAFALGDEFLLQPRDVVYVSAAPISRWNRWVSNVLPSLQGLFNLDRVAQ